MAPPPLINIHDFPEFDPHVAINSPRSLRACSEEGVAPQDLVYKTLDAFAERGLSPRLIKLRYDFFEAKRRDLLSSTRRTRDKIIDNESRDPKRSQLQQVAEYKGMNEGHLLALQGDTLKRERIKLLRSQQLQKGWLKNTLLNEVRQLQELDLADKKLAEEGDKNAAAAREQALRTKELNDKRAADEERKRLEQLAQQRYEKQMAKEEFMRQQQEEERMLLRKAEEDRLRLERNAAEQEKQLAREREKEEKRQREWEAQQRKLEELEANDMHRLAILDQKAEVAAMEQANKKLQRDHKIKVSQRNLALVEDRKRQEFEERQLLDEDRERKLAYHRALQQEEGAKRSFQLMMKRKQISEDAQKKLEDRRLALTESRAQIETRLTEHEQKKSRYLDFKRELDGLKEQNKQINVTRQRRKEEHIRTEIEESVDRKLAKTEAIKAEREMLWNLRRSQGIAAQGARESVKETIMRMKIRSKPEPKLLAKQVDNILANDIFSSGAMPRSESMPRIALPPA